MIGGEADGLDAYECTHLELTSIQQT